jgi:hypothetical protein
LAPAHGADGEIAVPASSSLRLDADDLDLLAERVTEKLCADGFGRYGDVRAVCSRFDVSVDYVYAHARELGAIRLGEGPKARLRFDLATVERRLRENARPARPARTPRRVVLANSAIERSS